VLACATSCVEASTLTAVGRLTVSTRIPLQADVPLDSRARSELLFVALDKSAWFDDRASRTTTTR
jgi:hypothetical protein